MSRECTTGNPYYRGQRGIILEGCLLKGSIGESREPSEVHRRGLQVDRQASIKVSRQGRGGWCDWNVSVPMTDQKLLMAPSPAPAPRLQTSQPLIPELPLPRLVASLGAQTQL